MTQIITHQSLKKVNKLITKEDVQDGLRGKGTRFLTVDELTDSISYINSQNLIVQSMESRLISGTKKTLLLDCSILGLDIGYDGDVKPEGSLELLLRKIEVARKMDGEVHFQVWFDRPEP